MYSVCSIYLVLYPRAARSARTVLHHFARSGAHMQVVDFFRQVNKDARVLKRMGSNGVHSCSTVCFRTFVRCLRKLGLGNPGGSVGEVHFDKPDPLDATTEGNRRWAVSVRGSGEFAMDEEEEDEDEEMADAAEIHEQVCDITYTMSAMTNQLLLI